MNALTIELQMGDQEGKPCTVFLKPGLALLDDSSFSGPQRRSVVYPIKPKSAKIPKKGPYTLFLFGSKQLISTYKELLAHYADCSYFGLGAATFIILTNDTARIERFKMSNGDRILFYEEWRINSNREIDTPTLLKVPPLAPPEVSSLIKLAQIKTTPIYWQLAELLSNLDRFRRKAIAYIPGCEIEINALANSISKNFDQLLQIRKEIKDSSKDAKKRSSKLLEKKSTLDSLQDYFCKINSALVYANTQALHGIPPFSKTPGFIRSHSLLGTGTAWRAAFAVYQELYDLFRRTNHPSRLRHQLFTNGNRPTNTESPPQTYKPNEIAPDRSILVPRVVYFSGRHGFAEDDESISFGSQVLHSCISPDSSLLTITHEVLHSHVRTLFSSVLHDEGEEEFPLSVAIRSAVARHRQVTEHREITKLTPSDCTSEVDYIRIKFVHACITMNCQINEATRRLPLPPDDAKTQAVEIGLFPDDDEHTVRIIRRVYLLFEEFFVHILDLKYFYGTDKLLFCRSIWATWSRIPKVSAQIEVYILRTVVAIASEENGSEYDRYFKALSVLRDAIPKFGDDEETKVVAMRILAHLDDSNVQFHKWLEILATTAIMLLDDLREYFVSNSVIDELNKMGIYQNEADDPTIEFLEGIIPVADGSLKTLKALQERFDQVYISNKIKKIDERARYSALVLLSLADRTNYIFPPS